MSTKPGKVIDARRYFAQEVERLHGVEGLAPVVMQTYALLHHLQVHRDIPPCELLVMLEAMAEHVRRDAQEWVTTATDYPADDPYKRELLRIGVADVLDKLEDAGMAVADMLEEVTPATVSIEGDHIVIKDEDGRFEHSFEIIRTNSAGSEDLN